MAQKTDLNVAPYYDDFDSTDNFHKVLFRPGFAVQARELTQLQSILQNQIEKHGNNIFKDGTVIIPGQMSLSNPYPSIQLASTFGSEDVVPAQYYNAVTPVIITGATSGVQAEVIGFKAGTSTTQPTLYLRYIKTGSDFATETFSDSENISANTAIVHTSAYASNIASATTHTTANQSGLAVKVESGIYYVRGQFVRVAEQTLVLSDNLTTVSKRVGFQITETLVTPETDTTLTDNATGSSNYAAKGAHRLKIELTLSSLDTTSIADSTFLETMRILNGNIVNNARNTEFSVLGDTLARRTFDESGDYTVRPFQFDMRETISSTVANVDFSGVYAKGATTDDGNTASADTLTLAITPGKAYVKGYEIEKIATTYKDIIKPRDVQTVNAGISVFETGNFVKITNVFGTPDISAISGETTAYNTLQLHGLATATRGSASGTQVGVARTRTMQYESGDANATDAIFRLYLFDIRPFTYITLSDTPSPTLIASHSNGGVQMTGVTSGATGFVHGALTTGTQLVLTNIVGTFSSGEKLTASDSAETGLIIENAANADLTISSIVSHTFADVRQIFMDDSDGGQDFTADCILEVSATSSIGGIALDGTDASSGNADSKIELETADGDIELETEKVATLVSPEKNQSLFKLPKKVINTLLTDSNDNASDSQITVRRQFIGTTNASGVVAFTAGSNETFVAHAEKDYTLSVLTAGDGSAAQGEIVSIADTMAGNGTATLTITDDTKFGDSAKVKLIATLLKTSVASKVKTTNLVKQLKVDVGATHAFGTRPTDKAISLGRVDAFKLVGVFDSESTSSDATAPELTLGTITGTFSRGELITGSASGAKARIIDTTSPMSYALTKGFGATDFTTADTITGESSGATSTVTALTAGSKVITNYFTLDTGQRDNYYDIARIERKPGFNAPRGRLLVIYDYFSHSAGSYFSVDSYSDVAGRMGYDDIPTYTATRVDPDDPQPSGEFPLADCFDFRPSVEDIAGTSTTVTSIDEITGNSFDFFSRQYDGTNATVVDSPQPDSNLQADFEFFLSKFATVFLTSEGNIKIVEGISAEEPVEPKDIDNAMKLASIHLPPFTFTPEDTTVKRYKTQRYTMRDIGRLHDRLQNVEYYTALSLLERDAESFEIQDANGLNRFKSGFVVDNFTGHRVGNPQNKDYKCAIDMQTHELRPKCVMRGADLIEQAITDTARSTAGYQKTGDLITRPYTDVVMTENSFATTLENVQPYLLASWAGTIFLSPTGDEWFETEVAPALIVNVDGNFDAVVAANAENPIGTVWNAWETQWTGVISSTVNGQWWAGITRFGNLIETTRTDLSRTGLQTNVVEQIDEESQGSRVISRALIPFVRPRNITVTGLGFKPNTRVYAFFDKVDVNAFVTPSSTTYTSDTTIAAASPLITTAAGKIECTFAIPEHRFAGQENVPKFKTGEVEFRLTSSTTDDRTTEPVTGGQAIYQAVGILETEQETIIATRNSRFEQVEVNQTTTQTTESSRVIVTDRRQPDPLAQTFICAEEGGAFITKIDLYFGQKDDNLPVQVQIRNVVNGYPGPKILAFGQKFLESSEVNVSEDASVATTFTFDSPIYLKEGSEYCVVTLTKSLNYKLWISQLGELDVGGSRTVSEQPHLGVLFKSQNNTTWNSVQSEDKKFTLYKAKFEIGTGTVTLTNDNIGDEVTAEDGSTSVYGRKLLSNPIVLSTTLTACQVKHPDHGMYSTSNNVKITGVKSEISTTLNGAITAAATSLTLTSGTGFVASNRSSRCYVKINNEIMFGTISGTGLSSITRGDDSTTAVAHATGATVELYQILGTPLDEINKTHTAIANIQLNSYTVLLTNAPTITGASTTAEVGGINVYASENYRYETIKTIIGAMELPDTTISAKIRTTTGTSPAGSETPFSTLSTGVSFPLNENFDFDTTRIVASSVNETNELSAAKSLFIPIDLNTTKSNISPVIDLDRKSMIAIGNVINNIDSSSDVYPTTDFIASTEPEGDQNAFIYITKRVALENPATALKVFFAANKHSSAELKLMFKVLRSDSADDFEDLGYQFFNTTGTTDIVTPSSLDRDDLQQYVYTAGVTDDGIGTPLPEFIQFAIKIVGQGTNAAQPPRIRDLRIIALAT